MIVLNGHPRPDNMTREPGIEASDGPSSVAEAPAVNDSGEAGTLMEVTFQKNPRHKYKYLEAEPKILGVTEIAIAVFFIGWRYPFFIGSPEPLINSMAVVFSSVGIIAGSVAIAAQNLHLPTLKACLGIQVVTCVAYTICLLLTLNDFHIHPGNCWHYQNDSEVVNDNNPCLKIEHVFSQMSMLDELFEAVQIALAATLAAYCCKVIPSCSPRPQVPVIIMAPPTAPQ